MSTEETKQGWSALAKGAVGTVVVAFAGFLGTAAIQVLSAPKDTVAYDFVQSVTGMLKGGDAPKAAAPAEKPAAETQAAAATPAVAAQPAPGPRAATAAPEPAGPEPRVGLPSAADVQPAPPVKEARAGEAPPQPGSMLDRVRQTTDLANKAGADTRAMLNSRVVSLNDKFEAPLCGTVYRVEVTSVAAGRGEVALRGSGGAAPIKLTTGAPREVSAGCRVELLLAMDDLNNRRAQLRETLTR